MDHVRPLQSYDGLNVLGVVRVAGRRDHNVLIVTGHCLLLRFSLHTI